MLRIHILVRRIVEEHKNFIMEFAHKIIIELDILIIPSRCAEFKDHLLFVAMIFTPNGRNLFASSTPIAPNPIIKTYRKKKNTMTKKNAV